MPAGATIGAYTIVNLLDRGATGDVYQVSGRSHSQFALKILRSGGLESDERRRFLRDADKLIPLRHRNIVAVFECGVHDDAPYLVMERLFGQTLSKRLKSGPRIAVSECLDIAIQMCDGLQHAHDCGVVHRDVKPANVWLQPDGGVKLLDFGLAHFDGSTLTRAGDVLGTAAYMSTEQVAGKSVDGRSDVFAVGIVLYELLAGRRPFLGDNVAAVMKAILEDTPQALTAVDPGLDPRIWDAVQKALHKTPDGRQWSASEFAHDLQLVRYTHFQSSTEAAEATQIRLPAPIPVSPAPERASGPAQPPPAPRPSTPDDKDHAPAPKAKPRHVPIPAPQPAPHPPVLQRRQLWSGVAAVVALAIVAAALFWWRPDSEYRFEVRSNPDGAVILINDVDSGQRTPAQFVFASRPDRVTLKMEGYQSAEAQLPAVPPEAPIAVPLERLAEVSPMPGPDLSASNDTGTSRGRAPESGTPTGTQGGETGAIDTRTARPIPDRPTTIDVPTTVVMVRLTGGYPFEISGCDRTRPAASEHEFEVRAPCTLRLRSSRYLLDRELPVTVSSGHFVDAAPQLARVQLRTARERCQIVVDGRAVGTQPVDLELASGRHNIVVHCDGRNYDIPDFMVEPGNSIRRLDDFLP